MPRSLDGELLYQCLLASCWDLLGFPYHLMSGCWPEQGYGDGTTAAVVSEQGHRHGTALHVMSHFLVEERHMHHRCAANALISFTKLDHAQAPIAAAGDHPRAGWWK